MNNVVDIPNFSRYLIDEYGTIYSKHKLKKTNIYECSKIKFIEDEDGYYLASLIDDSNKCKMCRVHRLVALTFLPDADASIKTVNHKDGNKKNNCVDNLEWVTNKENIQHYWKTDCFAESRKQKTQFSAEHRRKLSEVNLRRDPEIYRRAGQSQRGKVISEETRKKMSENQKRRGATQEFKLLNSRIHKGRRIMNNGEVELHVKPCDIEDKLKCGFQFGSLRRIR